MNGAMKKSPNQAQTKINVKSYKKYVGILRSLAKYDSSFNKMKVTVYEEDITELKQKFYLTSNPSSTESTSLYFSEDSFIEEMKSPIDEDELEENPDSSDLEGE